MNIKPIIKKYPTSKISENEIYTLLNKIKNCDIVFLTNYFGCTQSTARYYLKTLSKQRKIILSDRVTTLNPRNVSPGTTVLLNKKYHKKLFGKVRERFLYDKEFAAAAGFGKSAFSSWRRGKNRIPLEVLEKMCKILNLNFEEFCKNLVKEDREIAVIL